MSGDSDLEVLLRTRIKINQGLGSRQKLPAHPSLRSLLPSSPHGTNNQFIVFRLPSFLLSLMAFTHKCTQAERP